MVPSHLRQIVVRSASLLSCVRHPPPVLSRTGRPQTHPQLSLSPSTSSHCRSIASQRRTEKDDATTLADTNNNESSNVSSRMTVLRVLPHDSAMRFDRWLRTHQPPGAHLSLARLEKLIRTRAIRRARTAAVDDETDTALSSSRLRASYRVQAGDEFRVPTWLLSEPAEATSTAATPRCSLSEEEKQELVRSILYEDDDLCIINKPGGLAVHPGTSNDRRHLTGMLWVLEDRAGASNRPGSYRLVHRLDKETSGCVMLAKNRHTADILSHMLRSHAEEEEHAERARPDVVHTVSNATATADAPIPPYSPAVWHAPPNDAVDPAIQPFVQKRYTALVHGTPLQAEGSLVSPSPTGSTCHSSYAVISALPTDPPAAAAAASSSPSFTWLRLIPHTGRKRQLRRHAHFQLGCTIVGESMRAVDDSLVASVAARQDRQLRAREEPLRQRLRLQKDDTTPLFLHAATILLHHPALHDGRTLVVHAPEPESFRRVARK